METAFLALISHYSDKCANNRILTFALPIQPTSEKMMQAVWNGTVIAESDDTVVVENNHYFPRSSVREEYLAPSETTSFCGWKGDCNYHNLVVDGKENKDAVWYYGDPYEKAEAIRDRVAFWKGVSIQEK